MIRGGNKKRKRKCKAEKEGSWLKLLKI